MCGGGGGKYTLSKSVGSENLAREDVSSCYMSGTDHAEMSSMTKREY